MLAPAPPDASAQVIDGRDLADWIVRAAENGLAGTYNAVDQPTTRTTLFETCVDVSGSDAEFVWVDGDFLAANEVGEWMELPLWLHDDEHRGMLSVEPVAAFAAGLEHASARRDGPRHARLGALRRGADRRRRRARPREGTVVLDAWLSKE